jgi:glycosyltransferase involved in cell wall biosynthesis
MDFQKPLVVYVPCYNCRNTVVDVILNIPAALHARMECLVVDNQSQDGTPEAVLAAIQARRFPFKVHLARTRQNLDYAGSQKLAYGLCLQSAAPAHVIMLHGDGQYPPALLEKFIPFLSGGDSPALVNGYRDKQAYPTLEETPPASYLIIKTLSWLENLATGFRYREWHTGFVMYQTRFLRKIPLEALTPTRHIDGELLICAGVLNEKTAAVPIYKRYKDFQGFAGWARILYILDVAGIVLGYWTGRHRRLLRSPAAAVARQDYDVLA